MTDFAAVRAILDAATPGPWAEQQSPTTDRIWWVRGPNNERTIGAVATLDHDKTEADARAIVVARNLLPAALDVVAQAEDAFIEHHDRAYWHDSNRTHSLEWRYCTDEQCADRRAALDALAEPDAERPDADTAQEELDLLRAGLRTRGTIAEAVLQGALSGIVDADHPGSEDGTGKWRCRCSAHVAALAALAEPEPELAVHGDRLREAAQVVVNWIDDDEPHTRAVAFATLKERIADLRAALAAAEDSGARDHETALEWLVADIGLMMSVESWSKVETEARRSAYADVLASISDRLALRGDNP